MHRVSVGWPPGLSDPGYPAKLRHPWYLFRNHHCCLQPPSLKWVWDVVWRSYPPSLRVPCYLLESLWWHAEGQLCPKHFICVQDPAWPSHLSYGLNVASIYVLMLTGLTSGRAGITPRLVWAQSLCSWPQHHRDSCRKSHFQYCKDLPQEYFDTERWALNLLNFFVHCLHIIDKREREVPVSRNFRRQTVNGWPEATGWVGRNKYLSVYRGGSWKGWKGIEGKLHNSHFLFLLLLQLPLPWIPSLPCPSGILLFLLQAPAQMSLPLGSLSWLLQQS